MNSKKLFFSLTLLLSLFTWTAKAITMTVGTTGADFPTLKAAFDAINANAGGVYTGVVTLQIIDNTSEPTTVPAQLDASPNWTSVNIYPTVTGKTINGNLDFPLILFNGASKVTIDGRLHASTGKVTGSTRDLIITNTMVSANSSTIKFNTGASNNIVKYCVIKGSSKADYNGTINFASNGNSNNSINNNLITNADNANRPQNSIVSMGVNTANDNNTISDNDFANCINSAYQSRAIRMTTLNTNWTISGNSFYETADIVPTASTAITIMEIGTAGHTISGNFIGGTAAKCGGSPMTKTADEDNAFSAISLNTGTDVTSITKIENNTIQNIKWSNLGVGIFTGFSFVGSNFSATGNTIGAITGTGSITYTAADGGRVYVFNISNSGGGTTNISSNKIGSFTTVNKTYFYGVWNNGTAAISTVNNNIIGSTSTPNSINLSYSSTLEQIIYAIRVNNSGINTVNGNTIANIVVGTTKMADDAEIFGIRINNGTSTVNGNLIYNLTTPNSTSTNQAVVMGISINGSTVSSTSTISNNIISLGDNTPTVYNGIQEGNPKAATTSICFNTVYIGGSQIAGSTTYSYCLRSSNATTYDRIIKNNILVCTRNNPSASNMCFALATAGTVNSFVCDYNDYYASGTGCTIGSYLWVNVPSLPIVPGNDANSLVINPGFANAGGVNAADYKTSATLPAVTGTGILVDYLGYTRPATPSMGAIDANGIAGLNDYQMVLPYHLIQTSRGIRVTFEGEANVELYSISGQLIDKLKATGSYSHNLDNGVFIIRINGKASKFIM